MRSRTGTLFPRYLVLIIFSTLVLLPIVGLFLGAFKTDSQIIAGPFSLPSTFELDNFTKAWTTGRFGIFFKNSVIVATAVVLVSVFLSMVTGYAFSWLPLPGKSWLLPLVLLGYMVPFEAMVIPLYRLMSTLGLRDTYWALILPQIGLSVSFGTYWMSSFFESFPEELVDAATIDGCSRWQTLWRVLFPNSKPALTTLIVLVFMWTWNEFLLALVLVQEESLRTLPVGLAFFQGRYSANIPQLAAAAIIVAIPTILVYVAFQSFFIRGMMGGAVKG